MKTKTTEWKIEDYLKTPEQRAFYIEAAIDEAQKSGDMTFLATALSDVARAIKSDSLSAFFSGVSTGLAATKPIAIPTTRKRPNRVLERA